MKQQVLVIHGGRTFGDHEIYLEYLRTTDPSYLEKKITGWKTYLQDQLSDDYEVLLLKMPNKHNARYDEWAIWLDRHKNLLHDQPVVLVGESMGGMFLAKYLSERKLGPPVKVCFLIAAPRDDADEQEMGDGFNTFLKHDDDVSLLEEQVEHVVLYQSDDDPIVKFEALAKWAGVLPQAEQYLLSGYGHFSKEAFPELVEKIKELCQK